MYLCIDVISIIVEFISDDKTINNILSLCKQVKDLYSKIPIKHITFKPLKVPKIKYFYVYRLDLKNLKKTVTDDILTTIFVKCINIKVLYIQECNNITDKAFENLKGIHTLIK